MSSGRRHALDDPGRLAVLRALRVLDTPVEAAFDRLTRLAVAALHVPIALVSLVDHERQFFKSSIGLPEPWASTRESPLSHSFCQHVVSSGSAFVVNDARAHPLVAGNLAVKDMGILAYLGIPLETSEGYVLGSFAALDRQPRAWRPDEVAVMTDLAASVMTEIELRATQRRYQHLLEHASDIIYRTDSQGHFTDVNTVALRRLGYSREEIIGRHFLELIRTDYRPAARRVYACQYGQKLPTTYFEFPALARDGSEVWIGQNVQLILEDGLQTGFEAIARDITKRKQVEAELHGAVERWHLVSKATNDAIWDWDLATDQVIWNDAVQTLFGYANFGDDVAADHWRERIHPEDAEHVGRTRDGARLAGASTWSAQYRFRRADGTYCTVLERGIVGRDQQGRPTRMIGSMQDITASKQAEEERSRLRAEQVELAERAASAALLQASEERLRLALGVARMATWDWDPTTDRLVWAGEAVLGVAPESLGDRLQTVVALVDPIDKPALMEQLESIKQERVDHVGGEYRFHVPDLPVRWMAWNGRVFRDQHGHPTRVVGIAMDVTERKAAEQRAEALARGERLRALGQMASGIAHDLNQVLTLISGYGELARHELDKPSPGLDRLREAFEVTVRAAQDGGQSVSRLLAFARTHGSKAQEMVDVGDVLWEVARLTAPRWRDATQADGRPIDLHVDVVEQLPIHGTPATLREALTNLIFNAVDALPSGGKIHLSARRVNDRAIVEVRDTGIGMPVEIQARVFEPFFTTKGERGTGLGLSQVHAIVQQHQGDLSVESVAGEGTTMRLTFPLASPESRVSSPTRHAPEHQSVTPLEILVVDDEQRLAQMAATSLVQAGHKVRVATSGEAALGLLETRRCDVVLSDLGMGQGINGWDLALEVRRRWPETRFVLATGWGASIEQDDLHGRAVDAVLPKPYRLARLRQVIASVAADPGSISTANSNTPRSTISDRRVLPDKA